MIRLVAVEKNYLAVGRLRKGTCGRRPVGTSGFRMEVNTWRVYSKFTSWGSPVLRNQGLSYHTLLAVQVHGSLSSELAHTRQSRPNSGLVFHSRVLTNLFSCPIFARRRTGLWFGGRGLGFQVKVGLAVHVDG